LLTRVEDAGINASAPRQQLWLDGWLVRTSPGKARRARCINAVAAGRLPVMHKLALAEAHYRDAGLPLVVRITPFTAPQALDNQLASIGWQRIDETRVMVNPALVARPQPTLPAGMEWAMLDGAAYAAEVGALRGSTAAQVQAHAERLAHSPVPYQGYAIRGAGHGPVLACGQFAREAELVGLYDVFTREESRGQGLASLLCERLVSLAAAQGALVAYLQTEVDNAVAGRIYQRLGFAEQYRYHYRQPPGD
jgi:GNAT superfamily N-acetyltransferase